MRPRLSPILFTAVLSMLTMGTTPALAVSEYYQYSCDNTTTGVPGPTSPCETKPPKSTVMANVTGFFDANGTSPEFSVKLAKGGKKTLVTVDLTYEYFSASAQFRPLTVRVNDKFPAPNFVVLNHLTSCGTGMCLLHAKYWFDIDGLESVYPGQFYGQPLKVDLEASTKAADANNNYTATLIAEVVKKK